MNTATVTSDQLIVEPLGLDKIWSVTNRIEIPIAHVRGATFDHGANHEPRGLRAPGLAVPGKWSGTFDRLVLTVDERRSLVDQIDSALETT